MRFHRGRALALCGWLFVFIPPGGATAQAGTVEGRVRDDEGSAVLGARLRLTQAGTLVRSAETDRLGFFRMAEVPAGAYTLELAGLGFRRLEVGRTGLGRLLRRIRLPRSGVGIAGRSLARPARALPRLDRLLAGGCRIGRGRVLPGQERQEGQGEHGPALALDPSMA